MSDPVCFGISFRRVALTVGNFVRLECTRSTNMDRPSGHINKQSLAMARQSRTRTKNKMKGKLNCQQK